MPRALSFTKTVDLRVNGFPEGSVNTDIAKAIVDSFVGNDSFNVVSVQQCPNKIARVTFDNVEGRTYLLELGQLRLVNGVVCEVIVPPPPPVPWSMVVIYNYPYEYNNDDIENALKFFGEVGEIRYQQWSNLPGVSTATRLVRMKREKDIPRFMQIGRFRCKVWYRGQPITCDICRKDGHTAGTCPDKGKCRLCHQIGHMARECPSCCSRCGGEHTTLSCNRAWGTVITAPAPAPVAPAAVGEVEFPDYATFVAQQGDELPEVALSRSSSFSSVSGVDMRDNQLDELDSQVNHSASQSILQNDSNSVANNVDNSINNVGNEQNNLINESSDLNSDLNSNLKPELDLAGNSVPLPSSSEDSEMPQASGARKRPVSELSSDDSVPESSAPLSSTAKLDKRVAKRSTSGHHSLPAGISSAARLASGPKNVSRIPKKS